MSLGHLSWPASFEIIGTSESIIVQLAASPWDREHLREQLQAYFPDGLHSERGGYLESLWDRTGTKKTAADGVGGSGYQVAVGSPADRRNGGGTRTGSRYRRSGSGHEGSIRESG